MNEPAPLSMDEAAPMSAPATPVAPVARPAVPWTARLNAVLAARTVAAWLVTLLLFFPLGWLLLMAFKTGLQAIHLPPLFVFVPTLDNFREVQQRSDYLLYAQ